MTAQTYHLRITLLETKPPIWRTVAVPSSTTLDELHDILQIVMGWTNSHLHRFVLGGRRGKLKAEEIRATADRAEIDRLLARNRGVRFSDPRFELDDTKDEHGVLLANVMPEVGDELIYEYDFGDNWQHAVTVESITDAKPATKHPVRTGGALACPPEDCGGVWGYYELLEALVDPSHEMHEDMVEWTEGEFDAEAFDPDAINTQLALWHRAKRSKRTRRR
jgi:hypothetical protein